MSYCNTVPCHMCGMTFVGIRHIWLWGWYRVRGDLGVLETDSLVPTGKLDLVFWFCKVKLTLVGLISI